MRKFILLTALIMLATSVSMTAAQTATPAAPTNSQSTTQSTQTPSSVNVFYVACENQGVINFDGTMQPGFDIYYQLFSGPSGGGTALTSLRQVTVNGTYAVSDQVSYASGQTIAAGGTGSARVVIAREGSPTSTTLDTTVNDLQDGCNNPRNPLVSSTDAGSGSSTTDAEPTEGVRSPTGGRLSIVVPRNPIVVIGVPQPVGRSNKPGEIFAECDQYRQISDPGILYDDDSIMIFWSWYARTPEQIQQHLDNAIYEVKFQTAPLKNVLVSPVQQIGANYWVFYTAQVGNLSPGKYGVEFKLNWSQPTSDGYDDYGPGTNNLRFNSTCTFEIQRTPFGDQAQVQYNGMYSIDR